MKYLIVALVFITFCKPLIANEHPGGMHPKAQINFVKKQVAQKNEPFYAAFLQLLAEADTALTTPHHAVEIYSIPGFYQNAEGHRKNAICLQTDAFNAYSCALAWQLTDNKKYAERAVYFLNGWSSINTGYADFDGQLTMSYSGTAMVMAAELICNYKKWAGIDKQQFNNWLIKVYRKAANEIRLSKNNWGDWGRLGSILVAYYLDDSVELQENIQLIKAGIFEKIAVDGHLPEEVRRGANGIWYTYFSLAPMTAASWVAYNATGENLFKLEEDGKSIKKALDYLFYFNEHPSEWSWFKNPRTLKPGANSENLACSPANLLEAMGSFYHEDSYVKFVEPYRPLCYGVHHFAWTYPTLMPPKLSGYHNQVLPMKASR